MTRSSEFTRKVRGLAFLRCNGKCEACGAELKVAEGDYDHVIPMALGGESSLENCQVLCRPCHRGEGAKTAQDVKRIAKAKRTADKHTSVIRPKQTIRSAPFPKSPKADKRATRTPLPPKQLFQKDTLT